MHESGDLIRQPLSFKIFHIRVQLSHHFVYFLYFSHRPGVEDRSRELRGCSFLCRCIKEHAFNCYRTGIDRSDRESQEPIIIILNQKPKFYHAHLFCCTLFSRSEPQEIGRTDLKNGPVEIGRCSRSGHASTHSCSAHSY